MADITGRRMPAGIDGDFVVFLIGAPRGDRGPVRGRAGCQHRARVM